MLTESGGNEGLGFAIPAAIVNFDYQNLRKYGHVQRVSIGAATQNITPTLAAGLGLARSWGAIISDITDGGAAEAAGLQIDDIVLAIDGRSILGLPDFMAALYLHPFDQVLKIDVLRGVTRMSFNVPVTVYHDKIEELADIPDLKKILVRKLNIFVADLDEKVRPLAHSSRGDSGILVVAQGGGSNPVNTGLETGDIILAIARTPLQSSSQFLETVRPLRSGDAVVLQIERNGSTITEAVLRASVRDTRRLSPHGRHTLPRQSLPPRFHVIRQKPRAQSDLGTTGVERVTRTHRWT